MQYSAVIVPDQGQPFLTKTNSVEELNKVIRSYIGTETYAFPYFGTELGITKGPRRQLLDTNGNLYPLFDDISEGVEVDPTGYLN